MKLSMAFPFLMLLLLAAAANAQIVSIESQLLRDDIPATIQKSGISLLYPLSNAMRSRTGYRYIFADQAAFHGLPSFRVPLHVLEQSFEAAVVSERINLFAQGTLTYLPTDKTVGDFKLGADWSWPLPVHEEGPPILFTLRADGGRARDLSVTTAMHENISYHEAGAQLDISVMEEFDVVGRVTRDWYNDGNRKDAGYAYVLAHILSTPRISLGYAWSWANTDHSNWRATGIEYDPGSEQFAFEYFYYPYFTPIQERGHQLVAIVQWYLFNSILLHGKATVPVASRGRLKYMPETGNTPTPIDYDATYEIEDILPEHYEAGIITEAIDPLVLSLTGEYFSKPYYTYTAAKLAVQYKL